MNLPEKFVMVSKFYHLPRATYEGTKIDLSTVSKIQVDGSINNYRTSVKYLGYTINESFDRTNYVNEIIGKVNFSLMSKINHCKNMHTTRCKTTNYYQ